MLEIFDIKDINQLERQLDPVKDNPVALLRKAHDVFGESLAVLSSFGAESALLLAMIAEAQKDKQKDICILFLDTGKHFEETLEHKKRLIRNRDSVGSRRKLHKNNYEYHRGR